MNVRPNIDYMESKSQDYYDNQPNVYYNKMTELTQENLAEYARL